MFFNTGFHEQLAAATDPVQITQLQDSLLLVNLSRALLTAVFAGIALMVFLAARKRKHRPESTV